jgi:cell division protein FtsB
MAHESHRDDAEVPAQGSTPRGRRLLRVALVVVTAVVLVDAVAGEKGVFELMRAREAQRTLERDLETLRSENHRLLDQVRRYKGDRATIEELARRDLGMIKPGEKLFIIRDLPPAQAR